MVTINMQVYQKYGLQKFGNTDTPTTSVLITNHYLFSDHDIVLVVAVVCISQFTCKKNKQFEAEK